MINVLTGVLRISRRYADLAAFRGWLCFVVGCLFSFQTQAVSVHASDLGPLMLIIPSDADLPSHLAESKTFWIWAINDIVAQ